MKPQKNYIDERGNYHNVENLTLTQIHDRASEEGYRLGKAEGIAAADNLPQGEWLENVFIGGYICNNCNAGYNTNPKSPFCPICGAWMKNGQIPEAVARRAIKTKKDGQADE